MALSELSPVRLITDRYLSKEGVGRDAIGFIMHVFDDGYIVEFSRPQDGTTIALLSLKPEEIEPAPEAALCSEHASI